MKKLAFSFILFLCMTFFSCSNENNYCAEKPVLLKTSHRISTEQAQQNALEFVNRIFTTRGCPISVSVSEVKAISANKSLTRSVNDSINLDTLFYVVNFENENGFIIASSDDREIPIFAYIEEGNYEETEDSIAGDTLFITDSTYNAGFESFMCALQEIEINNRTKYHKNPEDDELYDGVVPGPITGGGITGHKSEVFDIMEPLLKTKWGQFMYNKYCPEDYTGCVVTAVSQICSYLKAPHSFRWTDNGTIYNCTMDWDRINSECTNNMWGVVSSPDLIDQVSRLMRFWGIVFNAEYDSSGTSVDSEYAISQLQEIGLNATSLSDYNGKDVISQLKKGNRIIYMCGNGRYYHVGLVFRKYVDGHAWVVDGYIHSIKGWDIKDYLHCNWGWDGDKNGYYLRDIFDTDEGPAYYDDGTPTRTYKNYQYNLKTSVICK